MVWRVHDGTTVCTVGSERSVSGLSWSATRTSVDKRSRRTALLAVILAGSLVACGGGAPGEVSARANIFGAGRDAPPAPGGGGAGVLPPVWQLPAGTERLIAFSRVDGQVNPIEEEAGFVGPAGDGGGSERPT